MKIIKIISFIFMGLLLSSLVGCSSASKKAAKSTSSTAEAPAQEEIPQIVSVSCSGSSSIKKTAEKIVVGKSTRSDVLKLLGKPQYAASDTEYFQTISYRKYNKEKKGWCHFISVSFDPKGLVIGLTNE